MVTRVKCGTGTTLTDLHSHTAKWWLGKYERTNSITQTHWCTSKIQPTTLHSEYYNKEFSMKKYYQHGKKNPRLSVIYHIWTIVKVSNENDSAKTYMWLHTLQMHVPTFLCQYQHRLFSVMQSGDHPTKRLSARCTWQIKSNSYLVQAVAHENMPVLESTFEGNY